MVSYLIFQVTIHLFFQNFTKEIHRIANFGITYFFEVVLIGPPVFYKGDFIVPRIPVVWFIKTRTNWRQFRSNLTNCQSQLRPYILGLLLQPRSDFQFLLLTTRQMCCCKKSRYNLSIHQFHAMIFYSVVRNILHFSLIRISYSTPLAGTQRSGNL